MSDGLLFTMKDVLIAPATPKAKEPVKITGAIDLINLPYYLPLWILATVTYPETWWEEIIPLLGAPTVRQVAMALGGKFKMTFAQGFLREGTYSLALRAYLGPTYPLDSIVLPPAPSIAGQDSTFEVSGQITANLTDFNITAYTKK